MTQKVLKIPENTVSNISFQQKSTALSLVITAGAAAYYFANMWPMRPIALENNIIPNGFGSLILGTAGLIIVTQIVLQIVLVIGAGAAPAATTDEKIATLKASRNAYAVLAVGIFAAVGTVFLDELTPFCTANLAILSFLLAEIVKSASQLFYGAQ
ncbi:MAG: hypothetical protein D6768_19155 [Chloroflexi bacterium]|nr:MAG: hypothetical protein D6768_19155 [Chloroflexota bacterium]